MAQSSSSVGTDIKSENALLDEGWSEELDQVPLKQRLEMLLRKRISDFRDRDCEKESEIASTPQSNIFIKEEEHNSDSQGSPPIYAAGDGKNEGFLQEENNTGVPEEYNFQGTEMNNSINLNQIPTSENHADIAEVERANAGPTSTSLECLTLTGNPVEVKVECNDEILLNSSEFAIKMQSDVPDDFGDALNHVTLKERWRMLLSRKSLELTKPIMEGDSSWMSNPVVEESIRCSLEFGDKDGHSGGSPCPAPDVSALMGQRTESSKLQKVVGFQENVRIHSSKEVDPSYVLHDGKDLTYSDQNYMRNSALTTSVNVKVEPSDNVELNSLKTSASGDFIITNRAPVKSELGILDMAYGDEVDHMLLKDRNKLLVSRDVPGVDIVRNIPCLGKVAPVLNCSPITSESDKPSRINRPRKRKKTATDSVKTALEEDAPEILQVLIGKGISVDDIKLYGKMDIDEALDDSISDDSFSELEAVISKVFGKRNSLLKLPPIWSKGGNKPTYCFTCLISLAEQARYVQSHEWPVEWGWCRDLQSFIFVFERHNRIVLERPEYGFATYFFELLSALSVDWQIKRLVTTMKLPNCGRVALLEDRPLVVGKDLTEGEARVLTDYGWTPNCGLGTMLNYCDRVVHDKKSEDMDALQWSSKIKKLLTDGYKGGSFVTTNIPMKFAQQQQNIKLEEEFQQ